jgi:peptidoglycan/xylan/chitin deacetylase (PgdA/CDA1 family)
MKSNTAKSELKYLIKQMIMLLFYCIGIILPKRRIPIIVYHSVDESGSCISMRASEFKKQMEFIKDKGYKTLTASELVDILRKKGSMPKKAVVLTFDDGFENNYNVVFPILKSLALTATIFLTTDYIGKKCTWDKKNDIPDLPLLSWEMISEMSKFGIDFQSHTATHSNLPLLSEDRIRDELRRSRLIIENKLLKKCDILCYPYAEFDIRVIRILQEEGYVAAFAGHPDREDIYSIRRVGSAQFSSMLAFKTALKGTFSLYYSLKKILVFRERFIFC